MMTMMSTCCSDRAKQTLLIAGGVLLAVGVAAAAWTLLSRHTATTDPLEETDRRIDELEHALHRLRNVITQSR